MFRKKNWKYGLVVLFALVSLIVPATALAAPTTYTVKWGDSLGKIAANYPGVTWQDICQANQLNNCNMIHVGNVLTIPTGTTVAAIAGVNDYEAVHRTRLEELDPTFRTSGIDAWRQATSMTGNFAYEFAPVEETWGSRQWVSGFIAEVENASIPWPAGLTTNLTTSVTGRCITIGPDSKLCTDVQGFNGRATFYGSALNWGQLWPAGTPVDPVADPESLADLATLGEIIAELEYPAGTLAGAQIRFSVDWTAPSGWVIQKEGAEVSSVSAGDVASVWVPTSMRPFPRD